jgi:hypothetical protein
MAINNGNEKINILSSRGLFTCFNVWRSLERRHDARLRTVDFFFILIKNILVLYWTIFVQRKSQLLEDPGTKLQKVELDEVNNFYELKTPIMIY